MRGPARLGAALDEALQHDVVPENACEVSEVSRQSRGLQKYLPSAKPVETGRRTAQPHRVAIAQTKGREHCGSGIGNQRRIEVLEAPAADHDADD